MELIANFHFLRPWLLCLLIPAALLLWYAWRTQHSSRLGMQSLIADHLLEHLLAAFWVIAVIALAGPSWQKEWSIYT